METYLSAWNKSDSAHLCQNPGAKTPRRPQHMLQEVANVFRIWRYSVSLCKEVLIIPVFARLRRWIRHSLILKIFLDVSHTAKWAPRLEADICYLCSRWPWCYFMTYFVCPLAATVKQGSKYISNNFCRGVAITIRKLVQSYFTYEHYGWLYSSI